MVVCGWTCCHCFEEAIAKPAPHKGFEKITSEGTQASSQLLEETGVGSCVAHAVQ